MSLDRRPIFRTAVTQLYLAALLLIAATVVFSNVRQLPFEYFSRDPASTTESHSLIGLISNVGILLWCASATACLFSAAVLWGARASHKTIRAMFWAGVITVVLLIDDLFLLHENIYPGMIGVNEHLVFIFYGVMLLVYFTIFLDVLRRANFHILLICIFCFGSSVLIDLFPDEVQALAEKSTRHILEDGTKFLGIVSWFGYYWEFCYEEVQSVIKQAKAGTVN